MRELVLWALVLLTLGTPAAASAPIAGPGGSHMLLQGDRLREGCLEQGAQQAGICQGYVAAVIDLEQLHSRLAERDPLYCIPGDLDLAELTRRVTSWLAAHPEEAGRAAVAQVTVALIDRFPCAAEAPAAPAPVGRH